MRTTHEILGMEYSCVSKANNLEVGLEKSICSSTETSNLLRNGFAGELWRPLHWGKGEDQAWVRAVQMATPPCWCAGSPAVPT